MRQLNLPPVNVDLKVIGGKYQIFDVIRKKYVALTPEEWVRQHIILYLIKYHLYPKGLIKVEGGVKYNKLLKRSDILIHDTSGIPYLLVECKSYDVTLSSKTFEQAAVYNSKIKAPFILISNGISHHCAEIDIQKSTFKSCDTIPPAPNR